jgi:hypothetical protein
MNKQEFVLKVKILFLNKKTKSLFLACLKFLCLSVIKNNRNTCECANRRVPCDKNLNFNTKSNCENQSVRLDENKTSFLKTADGKYKSF